MTDVAFHFGAPDKIAYACRLLRKAVRAGARAVVIVNAQQLDQLDADLWAVSPTDFVAHCLDTADAPLQNRSPVVLTTPNHPMLDARVLLVNLADTMPREFEKFSRLIEVVSLDDADRTLARQRWKNYTERGYALIKHDLQLKGAH